MIRWLYTTEPGKTSPTTLRSAAAALCLALVAGLTVAVPASAQPEAQPQAQPDSSSVVARHTITLITGDVVDLQTMSTGDQAAIIQPNPDRLDVDYLTRRTGDHLYLVPSDAMALLAAGKLDEELFNISALVVDGYGDADGSTIPLIVQYEPAQANAQAMAAPAGTTARFSLESINAVSVHEHKDQAGSFWTALAGQQPGVTTTLAGSVRKIWLNRKVSATLADSVPQVGAPQAWSADYDGTGVKVAVVDSGIDATHPDLDNGKVIEAANFSNDPEQLDLLGHGTHVASIVASTGDVGPTARKGVAPGAALLDAKVLDKNGAGTEDAIVEGLEWAADQGADVANLSLGIKRPSDGTEPIVQSVNAISQSSGMLVVASAGNLGEHGDSTISAPGWADEALTVGAVNKHDGLADFSSRGPRLGDYGIKPDITAPGVEIVAARAKGTSAGGPVDERYTSASGTSMSAPHVAGGAAILAQRFPGYTNRQLKDALVSTATTIDYQTVFEQGGGRLDVARATAQQVYASPGTLNLGILRAGQKPVSTTVTYTNATTAEMALELSAQIHTKDLQPAPAGMFTLSQPRVTVPANGTASVTVTVDTSAGPAGVYGGYLVGTAGETVVHTSIGAYVETPMYNVTVSGVARDGRPAVVNSLAELWSLETGPLNVEYFSPESSTVTFRVPAGTYNLVGWLATADAADAFAVEMALVAEPQLEITQDRSVTLDARTANQIVAKTPKPTSPHALALSYHRDAGNRSTHTSRTVVTPVRRIYVSPTAQVTRGTFEFYSKWELVAPPLQMKVTTAAQIPLDPLFLGYSPPVDGEHTLPLVYVGSGRPQDYAGRNVHGRIALIQRTPELELTEQIVNAANAGAWAGLVFNDRPGLLRDNHPRPVPIRAFGIERDPGTMLRDLLQHRPVRLRVSGTSVSPYSYDLLFPEKQRIPRSVAYTVDQSNTAELDTRYAAERTGQVARDYRVAIRPYPSAVTEISKALPLPAHRTDYVSANDKDTYWAHYVFPGPSNAGTFTGGTVRYKPRSRLSESWLGRVSRPGPSERSGVQVTRTEDIFRMPLYPYSDSGGQFGHYAVGDVFSTKLYAGNQLLYENSKLAPSELRDLRAVAEPATYRLVFNGKRSTAWWRYSTETNTTWTFASRRPAEGKQERPPLLQVNYDLALDEYNQAPARGSYRFTMDVGYVPGATGPGRIRAQVWASFNDGATWKSLDTWELGNGKRQVSVPHPKAENTSGAVSLRVTATDSAGNSIDQTLYRAYGLKPAN